MMRETIQGNFTIKLNMDWKCHKKGAVLSCPNQVGRYAASVLVRDGDAVLVESEAKMGRAAKISNKSVTAG